MAMGMNFMKQHVVQEARINYVITNGGDYPGTVSQEAEAWYLIRAPRRFLVDQIWAWTQEVAKGAALMTQTTVFPRLITATWEVLPNKVLIGVGDANVDWLGAPDFTPEDQSFGDAMIKSLGREPKGPAFNTTVTHPDLSRTFPDVDYVRVGTDLGNVSWVVPVLHFRVTTKANGTPHHTWQMVAQTAAPAAFKGGLKVSQWMAASALDCLMQPEIIDHAWEEHRRSLDTHGFYHPIPSEIKTPSFEDVYGKGGNKIAANS
jgi:aminobenzoyl-glutamate utilization protein B